MIKKDKKQSFKNNVYEIDKEKLFNLNSNNDNNNILINSCIINKSNDIFQEIKKKENREIEKPENYDKNNYSFSYQGDNIFIFDMSKNKNIKYEIGFMLTNNGNTDWKVNETYLKTNKTSQIIFNDLKLNPLSRGEFQKVILSLPDLGDFDEGDFNIIFDFCVSNKISGKPIKKVVRIIPDPNKKIINDFRKEFGLSKKDYPDDLIYKTLKTCKFDFNKTFDFLLS